MTSRRRWLVAYDIRDAPRLRRVYDVVRSHGTRLQYSVFLCDLSLSERTILKSELREVINHQHDSVVFIDLGVPSRPGSANIEYMGTPIVLPDGGPTIV